MTRSLVLLTGYPGAGKSTLAAAIAPALGYPLVSKDAILTAIHQAMNFAPGDAEAAERCGKAAWAVFWMQAEQFPQAVLDTNIRPTSREQIDRLLALDARIVEVRCVCPAKVAQERYAWRAATEQPAARLRELTDERIAEYSGELGLGERFNVNTNGPVDLGPLIDELRFRLA